MLVITSEMTQNIQDTQETDRTPLWPEEQNCARQRARSLFIYFPSRQNSRLYDQTCSVQRMCTNVIVQQKGVKFQSTAESVQSPYHKKGMFPYLQGTIKLKAVSSLLGEKHLVCKHVQPRQRVPFAGTSPLSPLWPH